MAKRLVISFLVAAAAFVFSFIVFNIEFIEWATWRYPHNNSMAGFAAFIYGIPVGGVFAILGFFLAFFWIGRETSTYRPRPIASAPTVPSVPPTMFCAHCGCEVDPAAWLCAICGMSLHEPGAMISTRPYARATSKNSRPDSTTDADVFDLLLLLCLCALWLALEIGLFPLGYEQSFFGYFISRNEGPLLAVLGVLFLVILWGMGVFDRRR